MHPEQSVSEVAVDERESHRQHPEGDRPGEEREAKGERMSRSGHPPQGEKGDGDAGEHRLLFGDPEPVARAPGERTPHQALGGGGQVAGRRG